MFKEVKIEQNSPEWAIWRHSGIGASDIPVILGLSAYKSRSKLLAEKKQENPPKNKKNYILAMGHLAEKKMRAYINLIKNVQLKSACYESTEKPYMKVSLDGICDSFIWECKICGWKKFEHIKKGEVPEDFYAQVQYQMYIMNKDYSILSACRFDGVEVFYHKIVSLIVKQNKKYQNETIIPAVEKLWSEVQNNVIS